MTPHQMRAALLLLLLVASAFAEDKPRPLMRDFIGLNGHTVQFKPALYAPTAKLVRDYHPIKWDLGDDTAFATTFPAARNKVDWSQVYGGWLKEGLRINACLMFDDLKPGDWKDRERDAAAYGEAFARYFGPGGKALVEAVEIGNEPGKYSDDEYRAIFLAMAGAIRRADPKLRIATCAANLGPSGRYSKSVDLLAGQSALYDIVNIHNYAEVEPWPTWRRSFPEDPATKWVEDLRHVLTWRREHAPDKEVWLTEFGYDATTKPAPTEGDFKKWIGSTEVQQAQWNVRSWLVAVREGIDRAYLYFFNDDDTPHLHASSGLTRNFRPKPAFYAAAWLQSSLGDYRFARALREDLDGAYIYDFTHGADAKKRILAAWQPRHGASVITLPIPPASVVKAELMPLNEAPAGPVRVEAAGNETRIPISDSPTFVWVE
jgi:hypothetical protein